MLDQQPGGDRLVERVDEVVLAGRADIGEHVEGELDPDNRGERQRLVGPRREMRQATTDDFSDSFGNADLEDGPFGDPVALAPLQSAGLLQAAKDLAGEEGVAFGLRVAQRS